MEARAECVSFARMKQRSTRVVIGLCLGAALPASLSAQVSLTSIGTPVTIDFTNTVAGVNNGLFAASAPLGSTSPTVGQLDFNGWNYFTDGTAANAAQSAANFPGVMPNGNGAGTAGSLTGGISAVDINGHRALAIQPIGTHWTSGSITLRAQNNSAGTMEQIALAYDVYVYNDQARANDVRFYYSLSAAQNSWVEVSSALVISPEAADVAPAWVQHHVSLTMSGFSMNPGDVIYLRWVGNDVSGADSRDEFAFTNIVLTPETVTGPNIITSVTGLPPFDQTVGTPSVAQSFVALGTNLTGDVTVQAPAPFEASLDEVNGYAASITIPQVSGVAGPATIYVRLNSSAAGNFNGAVQLTSAGAGNALVGVTGTATSATLPVVYINEVMPHNSNSGITDENGEGDDWIELYSPGSDAVDLSGWYITNDALNLTQYQFPLGGGQAVIVPGGFLLVWADDQSFQGDLHANFLLNDGGGTVLLVGPDGTTVVDQLTYGGVATNSTFGHVTDGTGALATLAAPTPGASNGSIGIPEIGSVKPLHGWPNPAASSLRLDRLVTGEVLDLSGRPVLRLRNEQVIDTRGLAPGNYVLRTADGARLRFMH